MDIKKHFSFKNVDGIVDSIPVSCSKAEWTKTAPTVPGFYWYRDDADADVTVVYLWQSKFNNRLYFELISTDEGMNHENCGGEFWSESLQVPK